MVLQNKMLPPKSFGEAHFLLAKWIQIRHVESPYFMYNLIIDICGLY
jgi:hypothetical protein